MRRRFGCGRWVLAAAVVAFTGCTEVGVPIGTADSGADVDADAGAGTTAGADADAGAETTVTADAAAETTATADAAADGAETTLVDTTPPLPTCDPPLALRPEDGFVSPRELLTLTASGGTGAYRFALTASPSGALIHPASGAYLAGAASGVDDLVTVSDGGCVGAATAVVHVVPPVAIVPEHLEVRPGAAAVAFLATGGSGEVTFTMLDAESDANLSAAGVYRPGPHEGMDRIGLTDLRTGRTAQAHVAVSHTSTLRLVPGQMAIPLGAFHALRSAGGSGHLDVELEPADAGVRYADGLLIADAPGTATLTATDRFTGQVATGVVRAVAALPRPGIAAGDSNSVARAWAGDLNGDGLVDGLISVAEADVAAYDGGAVYVYAGLSPSAQAPELLAAQPAQILSSAVLQAQLGRSLAVADVNADGHLDLVVGAPFDDPNGADSGSVFVFAGVAGAFFDPAPRTTLAGRFGGDNLGYAVAVCDFNGDGWPDLAAGARLAEDRSQQPLVGGAGAVQIYLGGAGGFGQVPDATVYGQLPDADGAWSAAPDARLGSELAAADVDGDGRCDLLATALQVDVTGGGAQDGAVMLFRGRGPDALSPGGVEALPAWLVAGDEPDATESRLGFAIAAGDVDGDALADLLIGQPYYRAGDTINNGAVRLFLGRTFQAGPAPAVHSPDDADWTWLSDGAQSYDYYGWTVGIAHWNDDLVADVLVGDLQGEVSGTPGSSGTLSVFVGRDGALPAAEPAAVLAGDASSQRAAGAWAVMGDLTGDGLPEVLARAAFDHRQGPRVGINRVVLSEGGFQVLDDVVQPAGGEYGIAVALTPDLTGDGVADVVVGAPRAQVVDTTARVRAGAVAIYAGGPAGTAAAPIQILDGFPGHTTSDRLGEHVAGLQDFDGDGVADLAVIASTEDTGNSCAPSRNNSGAVYVFTGLPDGKVTAAPRLTVYGPQANQQLSRVVGADVDGDGLSDLVVTGHLWDSARRNVGGFGVVYGRALPEVGPVLCDWEATLLGGVADAQLGRSVARVGDLDGDGCDEVAVGAWLDDAPGNQSGSVRVVWGWGPGCNRAEAHAVSLSPLIANTRVASSLAGGVDIDGDGLGDLALGADLFLLDVNRVGAAWIVQGSYLRALGASAAPWGDGLPTSPWPMSPADNTARLRVEGAVNGELFGRGVGLIARRSGTQPGALVVGRPGSDDPGAASAGTVSVYRWGAGGLDPLPVAALGGETGRVPSEHGQSVAAGWSGPGQDATPLIVVGARRASAGGLDDGAAWLAPLIVPAPPSR